MTHNKDNEELEVIFKSDGAGMREVHLLAKGRLVVFLVVFFSLFVIAGYVWVNRQKPESMQGPEAPSFVRV